MSLLLSRVSFGIQVSLLEKYLKIDENNNDKSEGTKVKEVRCCRFRGISKEIIDHVRRCLLHFDCIYDWSPMGLYALYWYEINMTQLCTGNYIMYIEVIYSI
jgi:hypothetical protein